MASIARTELFCWQDVEQLGDLERLQLVLETLPDEALMRELEGQRGSGRNDYPVRPVWNSLLAAIVFQHPSIESLRRELRRNAQLRELCGFSALDGLQAVPPAWVYSRFFASLARGAARAALRGIFEMLVHTCMRELPGFGEQLGCDGKALASFARRPGSIAGDLRGDHEANWGKHEQRSERADGTVHTTVKSWFGFTVHVIADTHYELPVAFAVSKASKNEMPIMRKLLRYAQRRVPQILERGRYFSADRGYDDTKLLTALWDQHQIKPIIGIRNLWKDGEQTKLVPGIENVVYDYRGTVSCCCPSSGQQREMAYGGFEGDRDTLKYRCPARHYGLSCEGEKICPIGQAIRIGLSTDRRVFTPVARSSYRWQTLYNQRSALERLNSRLDVSFGFEQHTIRGLDKMSIRVTMAFSVMLAMALGRVREQKQELMRSLVRTPA